MSMLDAARSLVTPELVSQLSAKTSESDSTVTKGLGAVIPMLMASLSSRSNDSPFMNQFASLAARSADVDASRPDALSTITSAESSMAAHSWLTSLFGDGYPPIVANLSRYAGVKSSAATALFMYAVPLLLGYFGRLMRSESLDADGLANRLRRERHSFLAAVPAELDALVPGVTNEPARGDVATDAIEAGSDRYGMGWVLPVALAAVAILGLLWSYGNHRAEQLRAGAGEATSSAVGTTGTAVPTPAPSVSIPTATRPAIKTSDFERIEFENGSSDLTAASEEKIRNIATTLRASPGTHVTVTGYTDNVGAEQANIQLSQSRANAVMNALTARGVDADQIRAQGFGSQDPAATNDTAEGRAQNRRVTVMVAP
jgi:outer membrane protein OmpA-like peptidoglycan-associated protein